jgi:hypothetical protein
MEAAMSIISMFFGGGASFGRPLVLRRYNIDEKGKILVDIVGRQSGVLAWLFVTMGLDAETSLQVSRQTLTFKSSSFFGTTYNTVPLTMISSTHCGYTKSAELLILGLIFTLVGLPTIILSIFGIILLIGYWLSKQLTIYIETTGGMLIGLSFKRSIIENVQIDIDDALKTTHLINRLVLYSQARGSNSAAS